MHHQHTVEKIGGTSMSQFDRILKNVIIGKRPQKEMYNRIFVVFSLWRSDRSLTRKQKNRRSGGLSKI